MRKKKFSLSKLFYDNRFVLVFSIVVSVVFWLVVAIQFSPVVTYTIEDVPVRIYLSNNTVSRNLEPLDNIDYAVDSEGYYVRDDLLVDITVEGQRYIVSGLEADEFSVIATTSDVNSAGTYSLMLTYEPVDEMPDYTITGVSQDYVNVYFDELVTRSLPVRAAVDYNGVEFPDDSYYFVTNGVEVSVSTARATGPKTEIEKATEILASIEVDEKITETERFTAELIAVDENGNPVSYTKSAAVGGAVTVTVPVYKRVELAADIEFINVPVGFDMAAVEYSVLPEKCDFGVTESKFENAEKAIIREIDFNELKAGENVFVVRPDEIADIDMSFSDVEAFAVTVTVNDVVSQDVTVAVANIVVDEAFAGYTVTPAQEGATVTVVGDPVTVGQLTPDDITAAYDFSAIDKQIQGATKLEIPLTVSINNGEKCWAYGQTVVPVTLTPPAQ